MTIKDMKYRLSKLRARSNDPNGRVTRHDIEVLEAIVAELEEVDQAIKAYAINTTAE